MMFELKLIETGLATILAALFLTGSVQSPSAINAINAIEDNNEYTIEATQSGDGLLIIDSHRGCELICNQ